MMQVVSEVQLTNLIFFTHGLVMFNIAAANFVKQVCQPYEEVVDLPL